VVNKEYNSEISKLNKDHDAVVLTNRGKGTHVLPSFDEFNEYEEYRHNRYLVEKNKEAKNDPDARLRSHEDVCRHWVKNMPYKIVYKAYAERD